MEGGVEKMLKVRSTAWRHYSYRTHKQIYWYCCVDKNSSGGSAITMASRNTLMAWPCKIYRYCSVLVVQSALSRDGIFHSLQFY